MSGGGGQKNKRGELTEDRYSVLDEKIGLGVVCMRVTSGVLKWRGEGGW